MGFARMVAVALVAMFAGSIYDILGVLDVRKNFHPIPADASAGCVFAYSAGDPGAPEAGTVPFASHGFEDVSYIDAATAIVCAGDLHELFVKGPEATRATSTCVLLETRADATWPRVTELKINGFPPGVLLNVHGIDVVKGEGGTLRIFVVNHAYHRGGERVDVFTVDRASYALNYEGRIRHELFKAFNGVLNDLAVVSGSEFFITSYLPIPDPPRGRPHAETVLEHLRKARTFGALLTRTLSTKVLRCRYTGVAAPDAPDDNVDCHVALEGFALANGITHIPPPRDGLPPLIAVVDMLRKTLEFYAVTSTDALHAGSVPLTHTADNVEFDAASFQYDAARGTATAEMYTGSIVDLSKAMRVDDGESIASPGAATRVVVSIQYPKEGRAAAVMRRAEEDMALHDGSIFGGTASSIRLRRAGAADTGGGVAVLGSYKEPGIMMCPV